jgi:hypothetical protein
MMSMKKAKLTTVSVAIHPGPNYDISSKANLNGIIVHVNNNKLYFIKV